MCCRAFARELAEGFPKPLKSNVFRSLSSAESLRAVWQSIFFAIEMRFEYNRKIIFLARFA